MGEDAINAIYERIWAELEPVVQSAIRRAIAEGVGMNLDMVARQLQGFRHSIGGNSPVEPGNPAPSLEATAPALKSTRVAVTPSGKDLTGAGAAIFNLVLDRHPQPVARRDMLDALKGWNGQPPSGQQENTLLKAARRLQAAGILDSEGTLLRLHPDEVRRMGQGEPGTDPRPAATAPRNRR